MNEDSKTKRKPSVEKPWLQYFPKGAEQVAHDFDRDKTIWDYIEERNKMFSDVDAVSFMGHSISREQFDMEVERWARVFRDLGVQPGDEVPIYAPYIPSVGFILFALNAIGATAINLKFDMAKDYINQQTPNSNVAVIFSDMYNNIKEVVDDARFKNVVVVTPFDSLVDVNMQMAVKQAKEHSNIPDDDKYVWADKAYEIAEYNKIGSYKVPFEPNRPAFVTYSSGTTVGGVPKGPTATNESVLAQLQLAKASDIEYYPGGKCLSTFPFSTATALALAYLYPLQFGQTVLCDPRCNADAIFQQVMQYKAQINVLPGPLMRAFFKQVKKYHDETGKYPDLSFVDMFILGAEGLTPRDYDICQDLFAKCGAKNEIISGYGLSEIFSAMSYHKPHTELLHPKLDVPFIDVGFVYPGVDVKIVGEDGEELGYGEFGELLYKSEANNIGYHNNPEATAKIMAEDGYQKSGDDMAIDENGLLYHRGRMSDFRILPNGERFAAYNVGHDIARDPEIKYCAVNYMPTDQGEFSLGIHVVFTDDHVSSSDEIIRRIDDRIEETLPEDVRVIGYHIVEDELPMNPKTLKTNRNALMEIHDGYLRPSDNEMMNVSLVKDGDMLVEVCEPVRKAKTLVKKLG